MKELVFLSILFLISANSFSQQTNPESTPNKHDYLQKSNTQKKTGRIFLISGAGLMLTSFLIPKGDLVDDGICVVGLCDTEYKNDGIKSGFFIAGAVAGLTSIPFFIASGKNRRKAASLGFKMENTLQLRKQNFVYSSFPALRLHLNL